MLKFITTSQLAKFNICFKMSLSSKLHVPMLKDLCNTFRTPEYEHLGPKGINTKQRRLCGTMKLFLAALLPNKNRILYVDNDILFLDAPSSLWNYFYQMNDSQLLAMAHEYRHCQATMAHYPTAKINSGVILMDLAKMRENKFHSMASRTYELMRHYYITSDQGIFDIILGHFPEKMLSLPKQFNWIRGMCPDLTRQEIESMPLISIIHGSSGSFGQKRYTASISNSLHDYWRKLSTNIDSAFLFPILNYQLGGTNVVYPSVFQTFQGIDMAKIMLSNSQNLSQVFQNILDEQFGMYLDPCHVILPHLLSRYNQFMEL